MIPCRYGSDEVATYTDIVSLHFNHFHCTEICAKLRRDLALFTYIYLNVDEC